MIASLSYNKVKCWYKMKFINFMNELFLTIAIFLCIINFCITESHLEDTSNAYVRHHKKNHFLLQHPPMKKID